MSRCRLYPLLDAVPCNTLSLCLVDSNWNVTAHGDAREKKLRGNWRMEWVASTTHTTSEHGVRSITTADAHTSAASSRLKLTPPGWFKIDSSISPKDKIWLLPVCHHISTGLYLLSHSCYIFQSLAVGCGVRRTTQPDAFPTTYSYPTRYAATTPS